MDPLYCYLSHADIRFYLIGFNSLTKAQKTNTGHVILNISQVTKFIELWVYTILGLNLILITAFKFLPLLTALDLDSSE